MRIFIWCMSAVLFASSCASLFAMVNASFDPMKHPMKHPIRSVSFWKDFRTKSWSEKIGVTPPPELIDYLRKDNQANGWPDFPKIVNVPNDFLKDLRAAMEGLPPVVSQKINAMLIGVFLVSDLGGTGYTEYVVLE